MMAQLQQSAEGRYPMKHRATAETFNRHFHQLNDTGNNGNKQDKAQEAEVYSINQRIRCQYVIFQQIVHRQSYNQHESNGCTQTYGCLYVFSILPGKNTSPRKYAKIILSTKMDFTNKLKYSIFFSFYNGD